jgi:hypothetical protein
LFVALLMVIAPVLFPPAQLILEKLDISTFCVAGY